MTRVQDDLWITVTDFRRNIHRVLREVEQGQSFTIVRRGRPIARLVPYGAASTAGA
jgi:prevent-host-death family protein